MDLQKQEAFYLCGGVPAMMNDLLRTKSLNELLSGDINKIYGHEKHR